MIRNEHKLLEITILTSIHLGKELLAMFPTMNPRHNFFPISQHLHRIMQNTVCFILSLWIPYDQIFSNVCFFIN
ncbi:hypothetical protein HanIR_Chr15g0777571 [Helianthus annuus]|nr:hypothetical protein HanIR_Chr15g0777571 [Helianthus annuus]